MNVVEIQKQRIAKLEKRIMDMTSTICAQVDVIQNQSNILAYLTDDKFREFASENDWNKVIVDFKEGFQ